MTLWPSELGQKELTARAAESLREYEMLQAGLRGFYTEFDKFSKKNPKDRVTDLALAAVNEIIVDAKAVIGGDRYVDRVSPFVAAGENPTNGDVLLVLATLRSALVRFFDEWRYYWDEELDQRPTRPL